jgi:hypothetical protein
MSLITSKVRKAHLTQFEQKRVTGDLASFASFAGESGYISDDAASALHKECEVKKADLDRGRRAQIVLGDYADYVAQTYVETGKVQGGTPGNLTEFDGYWEVTKVRKTFILLRVFALGRFCVGSSCLDC